MSQAIILLLMSAEGQEICTDPENILIRQLLQKKDRGAGKGKQDKGKAADKGKRPSEAGHDRADAKRSHCEAGGSGLLPPCPVRLRHTPVDLQWLI